MRGRILTGFTLAVVGVLLAAGCSTLPTSGDVTSEPGTPASNEGQSAYFVPPGPAAGADREAVVRGFLLAAQANPPSTAVARSFLSERARSTWKPAGVTVYTSSSLEATPDEVVAHLASANRIDGRGSWAAAPARSIDLGLTLVLEDGEWRISNPPTSLPVPTSYFRTAYLPYLLYFFDSTGTVLVPSRVYLPRGDQVASSLVRGLLAGPPASQSGAAVTAFGDGIDLDLAVVIDEKGVAEVPLSSSVQRLSRADLYRAVVQLAATLRQVSGVTRVRVTVGGVAVPLVNGQTDVGLEVAGEFDPVVSADRTVAAIADGRVVLDPAGSNEPVGGPLGEDGPALRSLAYSPGQSLVAAVTQDGRRVVQAPTNGDRGGSRLRTVVSGASNLLKPGYDRFGNLWVVDAAPGGAVVHVVRNGRDRVVEVRGITGRRVAAVALTRDGATLVAGLAGGSTPALMVSALERSENGALVRARSARRVLVRDADLATIVDVAQDSASGVVVLARSTSRGSRLVTVEIDGSPGPASTTEVMAIPGEAVTLLAAPDDEQPTLVVTSDGDLLRLSSPQGAWVTLRSGVRNAAYPQ